MYIAEEVLKVTREKEADNSRTDELENALKKYYELINNGVLKPRGNQLASPEQRINNTIEYNCITKW